MPGNIENASVESHTQYTHSRFRCRRCGAVVPKESVESTVCVNCERPR